jgi:hypothetical protein
MGNYNFYKDLEASHSSVFRVCDVIKDKGGTIIELGDTKDFDIRFTKEGKEYLVEVKEDLMSSKTGNVAIEFMSRGKPSGVSTSKSGIWVYIINNVVYFTTLSKLKNLIQENDYFKVVKGGDNKTSLLCLIPQNEFFKICKT